MDRAAVAAIAALNDDIRRALFEYVRAAARPITREEAARAVGISRKLAAFHLDKLVELGVLRSGFEAAPQRRVGRAPRCYERADVDITVRLPERHPELIASILVEAITTEDAEESAGDAAARIAHSHGVELGQEERARLRGGRVGVERAMTASEAALARKGFEPFREGRVLRMRNCPFHPLATMAPEFVCGLNHAYVAGMVEGLDAAGVVCAELAPRPGECCVALRPVTPGQQTDQTSDRSSS